MEKILIFGDSYSTYEKYIPDGYPFYYCLDGRAESPSVTKMKVEETWWARVLKKINGELVQNNSWSGSTIGYTGYNDTDCSTSSSFIYRYKKLKAEGFFEKNPVDKIFVFGGTNDSWSNAPLGEMQFSNWDEKDLYKVLPAICYFVGTLKRDFADAEIVIIINTDIKEEIQTCLEETAKYYGVKFVKLNGIDKECGHPSIQGMAQISEQILRIYE